MLVNTMIQKNLEVLSTVEGAKELLAELHTEMSNTLKESDKGTVAEFEVFGIQVLVRKDRLENLRIAQPTRAELQNSLNFIKYGMRGFKISAQMLDENSKFVCEWKSEYTVDLYINSANKMETVGFYGFGLGEIDIDQQKDLMYKIGKLFAFPEEATELEIKAVLNQYRRFKEKYGIKMAKVEEEKGGKVSMETKKEFKYAAANKYVPKHDLPTEYVPKHDLPTEKEQQASDLNVDIEAIQNQYVEFIKKFPDFIKAVNAFVDEIQNSYEFHEEQKFEDIFIPERFSMRMFGLKITVYKPQFEANPSVDEVINNIKKLFDFMSTAKTFESVWLNDKDFVHQVHLHSFDFYIKTKDGRELPVLEYSANIELETEDHEEFLNAVNDLKMILVFSDLSKIPEKEMKEMIERRAK